MHGRFRIKGLFTWSGGPRSIGVGFFCFHALGDPKQKKLTQLDRGPPLHVNRVLNSLLSLASAFQSLNQSIKNFISLRI